jgi:hypothetical protein
MPSHALALDRCLQHQRHVLEQGIVGVQVWHNGDAIRLERFVGSMHQQRGVHGKGGKLGLLPPIDPHQFAGRSADHLVGGVCEEDRGKVKGHECCLLLPFYCLRG